MPFKKGRRLRQKMIVKLAAKFQHGRLPDLRHQIRRKIFRDAFQDRKTDDETRDPQPRSIPIISRNKTAEVVERFCLGGCRAFPKLIEDRDDECSDGRLKRRPDDHRDDREDERQPIWPDIF